jgi:hypothetical protein
MLRLCVVVHLVTGHTPKYVFRKMPLRLVFAYEHIFYLREGYKVRRIKEKIESILDEV